MAINSNNKSSDNIDLTFIDNSLTDCPDIIKKKVFIEGKYNAYFFYINGLVNKDLIQRDLMVPLLSMSLEALSNEVNVSNIPSAQMKILYQPVDLVDEILMGNTVFASSYLPFGISCKVAEIEKRSITEPETEKNVRGSHEGFIELLDSNLAILRRKINNSNLKFKTVTLGTRSSQNAVIAYVNGIANMDIVNNVNRKISEIDIDGLMAIGYIEQIIKKHPHSIFPQFISTERPDKAMSTLLDGGIVILLEGTPVVLLGPVTFFAFFQAMDDYSTHWVHGTFLRLIRFAAFITAILLPSLYIALTSYHYYAVPLNLLVPLAESRAKVPFPPIVEVIILEAYVEMLREAAVRLPTYIGTAISVVAGLIIGQAAVSAGIVSNLLIVIVAATAVASFVMPSYDMALAVRILRFIFIIAAAVFGIIGVVICLGFTLVHLVSMESLGQPYFQPVAPLVLNNLKDTIIRLPIKYLKRRPKITLNKNKNRSKIDERKS